MGRITIHCEVSQILKPYQLFRNIYQVFIFHPGDTEFNTVFSGILVMISRWVSSHDRQCCWAGCTQFIPPAAEIDKWEWWGIECSIWSDKWFLERTARVVYPKWCKPRWHRLPQNHHTCQNWLQTSCGWYHLSCSACASSTPILCHQISPWLYRGWAWIWRCSWSNTNIWSEFNGQSTRRDRDMV